MKNFTPKEIVNELDRFIIGQNDAKKAVAIALRNRWRRSQISNLELQKEILPKNILMIGPTGVGKTEIARRLANLAQAPFVKVEATKFTEIGYVGRDVEQIIRDLVETAIAIKKKEMYKEISEEVDNKIKMKILNILVGPDAKDATRKAFLEKLQNGDLDDTEIEIELKQNSSQGLEITGMPGAQVGMINMGDILGKAFNNNKKVKKMKISQAFKALKNDISEDLVDEDKINSDALISAQEHGIVFIDEIDKICGRSERNGGSGPDVSREGVQRDLLPLIEGCCVNTKYGQVQTDHILFITSGAFHLNKPSDLLPELQGRLPIRVNLSDLRKDEFIRILTEPEANLITQYKALLKTENLELNFKSDAIEEIANLAVDINQNIENIGARRLHTIIEKLLKDLSFNACDKKGEKITIDSKYVKDNVAHFAQNSDLSKFIL